jgi:hypothetical protein
MFYEDEIEGNLINKIKITVECVIECADEEDAEYAIKQVIDTGLTNYKLDDDVSITYDIVSIEPAEL